MKKSYQQQAASRYQQLALRTAAVALSVGEEHQNTLTEVTKHLEDMRISMERKISRAELAIVTLPANATADEVSRARSRQAIRRGVEIYLPRWSAAGQALPNALFRSALFSTSTAIQNRSPQLVEGDTGSLTTEREIATGKDMTLKLLGTELCQFDRKVYSTCVDYYRDVPLSSETSATPIRTDFNEFCSHMGQSYGRNSHEAIRESLIRLSGAGIELRQKGQDVKIPHLLNIKFEQDNTYQEFKGSDSFTLSVPVALASLFGPGAWTTVDKRAVRFDGLQGWIASFYASHSRCRWLDVGWLYRMTGYQSHERNFRSSLARALEKLAAEELPDSCRLSEYHFSQDGSKLLVLKPGWPKPH